MMQSMDEHDPVGGEVGTETGGEETGHRPRDRRPFLHTRGSHYQRDDSMPFFDDEEDDPSATEHDPLLKQGSNRSVASASGQKQALTGRMYGRRRTLSLDGVDSTQLAEVPLSPGGQQNRRGSVVSPCRVRKQQGRWITSAEIKLILKFLLFLGFVTSSIFVLKEDIDGNEMLNDETAAIAFLASMFFSGMIAILQDAITCVDADKAFQKSMLGDGAEAPDDACARRNMSIGLTTIHGLGFISLYTTLCCAVNDKDELLVLIMAASLAMSVLFNCLNEHINQIKVPMPSWLSTEDAKLETTRQREAEFGNDPSTGAMNDRNGASNDREFFGDEERQGLDAVVG